MLSPLAQAHEVDHAQRRASLAAGRLIGRAMVRYAVTLESLLSAAARQVAGRLGPSVQRYLTDPAAAIAL